MHWLARARARGLFILTAGLRTATFSSDVDDSTGELGCDCDEGRGGGGGGGGGGGDGLASLFARDAAILSDICPGGGSPSSSSCCREALFASDESLASRKRLDRHAKLSGIQEARAVREKVGGERCSAFFLLFRGGGERGEDVAARALLLGPARGRQSERRPKADATSGSLSKPESSRLGEEEVNRRVVVAATR